MGHFSIEIFSKSPKYATKYARYAFILKFLKNQRNMHEYAK